MISTSAVFVRTMLLAATLAIGSPAFAQNEPHDIADDGAVTAVAALVPDAPPTVRVSVPIRAWQLAAGEAGVGGGRVAERTSWPGERSIGSVAPMSRLAQPRAATPRSAGYKGAQRVLAGVAMGVLGVVAGTLVGAMAGSAGCGCEDGALSGMVIGAPVGGAAGATLGVLMVR
jgi:hypothetical protein